MRGLLLRLRRLIRYLHDLLQFLRLEMNLLFHGRLLIQQNVL